MGASLLPLFNVFFFCSLSSQRRRLTCLPKSKLTLYFHLFPCVLTDLLSFWMFNLNASKNVCHILTLVDKGCSEKFHENDLCVIWLLVNCAKFHLDCRASTGVSLGISNLVNVCFSAASFKDKITHVHISQDPVFSFVYLYFCICFMHPIIPNDTIELNFSWIILVWVYILQNLYDINLNPVEYTK